MAVHSSILAWRILWTEEPGGLQSMGCKESDTTEQQTLLLWEERGNGRLQEQSLPEALQMDSLGNQMRPVASSGPTGLSPRPHLPERGSHREEASWLFSFPCSYTSAQSLQE